MSASKDLLGQRFGKLVVSERVKSDKYGNSMWLCICDCGVECVCSGSNLRTGHSQSCGCTRKETLSKIRKTHGDSNSRLYNIWSNMKARCDNPKNHAYHLYGKRGIKVCDEWHDNFEAFRQWAVSHGYEETENPFDRTIDRINADKGYSPDNCRWVNMVVQNHNRRNNVIVEHQGGKKFLVDLCRDYGVPYCRTYTRIKRGWSVESALTTPRG